MEIAAIAVRNNSRTEAAAVYRSAVSPAPMRPVRSAKVPSGSYTLSTRLPRGGHSPPPARSSFSWDQRLTTTSNGYAHASIAHRRDSRSEAHVEVAPQSLSRGYAGYDGVFQAASRRQSEHVLSQGASLNASIMTQEESVFLDASADFSQRVAAPGPAYRRVASPIKDRGDPWFYTTPDRSSFNVVRQNSFARISTSPSPPPIGYRHSGVPMPPAVPWFAADQARANGAPPPRAWAAAVPQQVEVAAVARAAARAAAAVAASPPPTSVFAPWDARSPSVLNGRTVTPCRVVVALARDAPADSPKAPVAAAMPPAGMPFSGCGGHTPAAARTNSRPEAPVSATPRLAGSPPARSATATPGVPMMPVARQASYQPSRHGHENQLVSPPQNRQFRMVPSMISPRLPSDFPRQAPATSSTAAPSNPVLQARRQVSHGFQPSPRTAWEQSMLHATLQGGLRANQLVSSPPPTASFSTATWHSEARGSSGSWDPPVAGYQAPPSAVPQPCAVLVHPAEPVGSPIAARNQSREGSVENKIWQWLRTIPIGNGAHRGWDETVIADMVNFALYEGCSDLTAEEIYKLYVEHQVDKAEQS